MPTIEVRNATRQSVLGGRVSVARTHWTRLRGMLGRPEPEPGEGLLIVPCKGVHMYGMKYPLDIVFLNREGAVVDVREDLRPRQRTGFIRGSHYALEIPTGTVRASGTRVGDQLVWQPTSEQRSAGDSGAAGGDVPVPDASDRGVAARPYEGAPQGAEESALSRG